MYPYRWKRIVSVWIHSLQGDMAETRKRGRPVGTTKKPLTNISPKGRGRPSTAYDMDETTCIQHALMAYHDEGGIGQTLRHYYYKLLSSGAIVLNAPGAGAKAYNTLSRYLSRARENKAFPWRGIVDPGRRKFVYNESVSLDDYIGDMAVSDYRLDIWRGQPTRIEIWTEKDGMMAFLLDAVEDYRIPVQVNKGYPSTTVLYDAAKRFSDGSDWLILYCGDFDPSGMGIEQNIREKLAQYGATPTIHRVALTQSDTTTLPDIAAQEIKMGDPRSPAFIERYGKQQRGFEVEAMPAHILHDKVLHAVEAVIDMDAFEEALAFEKQIRDMATKSLRRAVWGLRHELEKAQEVGGISEEHQMYLEAPTQQRVVPGSISDDTSDE